MPAILDKAVKSIMEDNPKMSESRAYAIATSQLQKSGDLKKGSQEATEKGKRAKAKRAKERSRRYKMEHRAGRKFERTTSEG
jgi:hypothetical protein